MLKLQKAIFSFLFFASVVFSERIEMFRQGKIIDFFVQQNIQSIIEFPENIAHVVVSFPEGTASYNVIENKLFFLLNGLWEGTFFVIGESGVSYPIRVKIVVDNPDIVLKVVGEKIKTKMSVWAQMEQALKELLTEKVQNGIEEQINQEFYKDKNIVIRGNKLFRFTNNFVGVVGEIENISKTEVVIPITQISIPLLVAISVDKEFLKPKEKTKVYLLFKGS
ncbi:MAG: hypothetical protein QXV73_04440 [Candidatus Micrarchaeia archaeon]